MIDVTMVILRILLVIVDILFCIFLFDSIYIACKAIKYGSDLNTTHSCKQALHSVLFYFLIGWTIVLMLNGAGESNKVATTTYPTNVYQVVENNSLNEVSNGILTLDTKGQFNFINGKILVYYENKDGKSGQVSAPADKVVIQEKDVDHIQFIVKKKKISYKHYDRLAREYQKTKYMVKKFKYTLVVPKGTIRNS